jgi:type II secretory pathway pseudopilin PulG
MLTYLSKIHNSSAGDTIVEVMITVAVIGLALAGASSAVNRNVQIMEDQQEHAQAAKLVESQIEDLRTYSGTAPSCFYNTALNVTPITNVGAVTSPLCIVQADGLAAPAGSEAAYSLSITTLDNAGPSSTPTYKILATWDSLLGGTDQVSMVYRVN